MQNKAAEVVMIAIKSLALQIVIAIEDYLETPHDRSSLAKRRAKAAGMTPIEQR